MTDKTYARLDTLGTVMEVIVTSGDVTELFNPRLRWVDVTGHVPPIGWRQSGATFVAPPAAIAVARHVPGLAELQSGLASLTARFAAYQAALPKT